MKYIALLTSSKISLSKRFIHVCITILLSLPCFLFARNSPESMTPPKPLKPKEEANTFQGPFLTGPLLTPSANTIPKGHFNIELYVNFDNNVAYYNNHWHIQEFGNPPRNINIPLILQAGLAKRMDLTLTPQFFFNYRDNKDSWRFGDLKIGTSFQLLFQDTKKGIPSLKFGINETFPTGEYQNLNPAKMATDASGGGSFVTEFLVVTSYLVHFKGPHYLAARWQVSYLLYSQVNVHGFNSYGGDYSTVGWVLPGGNARTFVGFEYTLSTHWALAMDFAAHVTQATYFKGITFLPVGTNHWSYQLSLAPALEYNKNEHLGMIMGVWFTIQGENAFDFINGIIAVNWYI